jgi:peptidylprolyl isomerase
LIAGVQGGTTDPTFTTKIQEILRIQDRRLMGDPTLLSYFDDPDLSVRERAVLACGSLQDTTLLPRLLELLSQDSSSDVQYSTAFAIGQTATVLSPAGVQTLEHEIIWNRLDYMKHDGRRAPQRMIEELGKFGSKQALADLMTRFGNGNLSEMRLPLIMSIARFAIRGITSLDADRFVLSMLKDPDSTPWQAVYALQRIGRDSLLQEATPDMLPLYQSNDPLVRMYFATFLGKNGDRQLALEPLKYLAENDRDWRVQVNALKALGLIGFTDDSGAVALFTTFMSHANMNIALTALATIGTTTIRDTSSSEVKELLGSLRQMALNSDNNYPWQLQAEAATSLAKIAGKEAVKYIQPKNANPDILEGRLITALGMTGSAETADLLLQYSKDDKPLIQRSALEGLLELGKRNESNKGLIDTIYSSAIGSLQSEDVAVVTTAASTLGDSIFMRPAAIPALANALSNRRLPDDIEAMQEIISTLGKIGDRQAVPALEEQLKSTDRSVAVAAASALKLITKQDYEIADHFEPVYTNYDFAYLAALPPVVRVTVGTARGDIEIELYKDEAPFTVMSFLKLATDKTFYRGTTFHRVVPNFVIQGGDPRGDGWGGPGYTLRSEFSERTYEEGMVGIASAGKDTEGSQFFITQSPQPHLDGRYTIIGRVVKGMNVVNLIQATDQIYDVKINN